jgi:hypothetical protein
MPLAILLQEHLGVLTKGVTKVARWQGATETLTLVVARLRSAYLVRWFGTPLPVAGLALRVAFVNLADLRSRWLAIGGARRGPTPAIGPSLTEPLLGMGGTLVGILASPAYGMLLGAAAASLLDTLFVQIFGVVNWLTVGLTGTAVFGIVGVAGGAGLLWILSAGAISGQLREPFDLLGALAELAEPLVRFWEQVSGPREAVSNPLLRELLVLGDRAAALLALLIGAFAVLITRVAPLLDPLRIGIFATVGLVMEIWGLVLAVGRASIEAGKALWEGPDSIPALLAGLVLTLRRRLLAIRTAIESAWDDISFTFDLLKALGGLHVLYWWQVAEPFVRAQTIDHPTAAYVRSFLAQVSVARAWRARTAAPASTSPSTAGRAARWVLRQLGMPPAPTLPSMPGLPPFLSLRLIDPLATVIGGRPDLFPSPLALGGEGAAVLERARRPPSVFAGEWAVLRREAWRPEAVDWAVETATYLSLVDRVVSPGAGEVVRELEGVLSKLDASIRARRPRDLPVRDLPGPTELVPAIRTLRVRVRGLGRAALESWVEDLRTELNAAPYPVPAEG